MTEWIDTNIEVYGAREDLDIFKNDVSEVDVSGKEISVFSFNKIIPMPDDVSAWEKEGEGTGWYYWQIENWDVKWGARYTFVTDKEKYLHYTFDNPWGPPFPIFKALIELYPRLSFDIITRDLDYEIDFRLKSNTGKIITLNPLGSLYEVNCEQSEASEPSEPMDNKRSYWQRNAAEGDSDFIRFKIYFKNTQKL